jgi:hypothetical protein
MVGPLSDDRRNALNARIRAAIVLVVAVSGAMVAVQAGGSLPAVAAGTGLGALVGYAAVRYLSVLGRQARLSTSARSDRSFRDRDDRAEDEDEDEDGADLDRRERPPRQRP